jgi:hypothetical protein
LDRVLELGFLLALVGTVVLACEEARRRASFGLVLLAVAVAAVRAAGVQVDALADERGFAAINGGLLAGGIALGLAAAAAALLKRSGWGDVGGAASLSLGGLAAAWGARVELRAAPTGRVAGVSILVVLLAEGVLRLTRRGRRPEQPDRLAWDLSVTQQPLRAVLAVATLAVSMGPHLAIVFGGALVAACANYLLIRRADGGQAVPILPILSLLLVPTGWLMAIIAGPEGLSMRGLPDLPLSPAAQILLAPPLLLVAFGFAGLWPFHRQGAATLLAVAGALLLARVGAPVLPDGMEHWRALAYPLLVAGLWHAALTRRAHAAAAAGALLGLCSLAPGGMAGSAWLLAGALIDQLSAWAVRPPGFTRWAVSRLGWIAIGWGGLLALTAGLHAEVVYSVLGAVGVAIGLLLPAGQDAGGPLHRGASSWLQAR